MSPNCVHALNQQALWEAATTCPTRCKLTFDLLTLKVVSESRVTWATSVPISVLLGLSVLDLGPMYTTDRQRDVRCALFLNALYARGRGIKSRCTPRLLFIGSTSSGQLKSIYLAPSEPGFNSCWYPGVICGGRKGIQPQLDPPTSKSPTLVP